jgi:hypothetical protein
MDNKVITNETVINKIVINNATDYYNFKISILDDQITRNTGYYGSIEDTTQMKEYYIKLRDNDIESNEEMELKIFKAHIYTFGSYSIDGKVLLVKASDEYQAYIFFRLDNVSNPIVYNDGEESYITDLIMNIEVINFETGVVISETYSHSG